jgi:predicted NUDIX family NTP pyrophosphohydrolase
VAAKRSAGILLYRMARPGLPELLIAHMGGPFWSRRDARAWSIPKGEYEAGEDPLAAAVREFAEELGTAPPGDGYRSLGEARAAVGKVITIFAVEGDMDADHIVSNTFDLEWPRGSGRVRAFPEVDRAMWASPQVAREKLVAGQVVFVDRLLDLLVAGPSAP